MKNEEYAGLRPRVVGEGHVPPGAAPAQETGHRENGMHSRIVIARPRRGRAISGRHCRFVPVAVKMAETKSQPVAAVTAQPLAALPPYGCGVPFTGVERLWQLHISARLRRPCNAPGLSLRGGRRPTWRPERAARGSALGVQSRRTRVYNRATSANSEVGA